MYIAKNLDMGIVYKGTSFIEVLTVANSMRRNGDRITMKYVAKKQEDYDGRYWKSYGTGYAVAGIH